MLLAAGCSSGAGERNSGLRLALTAADTTVFVGERTHLIASFDGDKAGIDGIGPVESGVAVETPHLSRATTFTLRVSRGQEHAEAPATEIFDPATGRWTEGPMINRGFYAATVTMLGNGKVLVFGGEDPGGFPGANAAVFE